MKWLRNGALIMVLFIVGCGAVKTDESTTIKLGVDVLLDKHIDKYKGKNIGLITNPTGVSKDLETTIDLLNNHPEINLTKLYGPEHGVRGDAQAGAEVTNYVDDESGLPVYSLYGDTRKPHADMLEDIDVLIFDIQDVGSRFYTYIYTMAYAMEAAQENDIGFVVLDRPNPLGGRQVVGPILEEEYKSFVGMYPIPIIHGMTVGEIAQLFNNEFEINTNLTVISMDGWEREMKFVDTNLPWILPSPNMPTIDTAIVYPGTALFEGTNISEGRGTTKPFELIGAPFIDAEKFASTLNELDLGGVNFRPVYFTPMFSKHEGELSGGVELIISDAASFNPIDTVLHMIQVLQNEYPDDFEFLDNNFFYSLIGNNWVKEELENNTDIETITDMWEDNLEEFKSLRMEYLLY